MKLGPSQAETKALAEARGCAVVLEQLVHDGTWAAQVNCPSHAAKVALLGDLADFDSTDPKQAPQLRRLAEEVTADVMPDRRAGAERLRQWVRTNIAYVNEPVEIFSPAWRTVTTRQGDCDDHARLLVALYKAVGYPARVATIGTPPRHVAAQVDAGDGWEWAETTLDAQLGEHPVEAADRLGERVDPALREAGQWLTVANGLTLASFYMLVRWVAKPKEEQRRERRELVAAVGVGLAAPVAAMLTKRSAGNGARRDPRAEASRYNALKDATSFAAAPLVLANAGAPPPAIAAATLGQLAAKRGGWSAALSYGTAAIVLAAAYFPELRN